MAKTHLHGLNRQFIAQPVHRHRDRRRRYRSPTRADRLCRPPRHDDVAPLLLWLWLHLIWGARCYV